MHFPVVDVSRAVDRRFSGESNDLRILVEVCGSSVSLCRRPASAIGNSGLEVLKVISSGPREMGRIVESLATKHSSVKGATGTKTQFMLPQWHEEEASCQASAAVDDSSGDGLTAVAKEFLTTLKKPDVNSFGQNFRYFGNLVSYGSSYD